MNTIRLNTIGDSPVVVKKGSQVQSQEKTVEITENGTTEVVPDAGFSLSKVTISTNVAGGGAGESGGVKFRYFDTNKLTSTTTQIVMSNYVGLIQATKNDGTKTIACLGSMLANAPITPTPKMLAVITDTKVILDGGELSTFEEACAIFNITEEELSVAEITKEQFYSLEA